MLPGLQARVRVPRAIRTIQVYGQRCSGTNALIRLIEANFPAGTFTEAYGFKHWFVPPQILFSPETLVLAVARDPVTWLQSLHRQPWHLHPDVKRMGFSDFIRTEWHSYWDTEFWGVDADHPVHGIEMLHERDPATGQRFANPMRKRTAKLAHWAGLTARTHNVALIDQGRVEVEPERVIRALADLTGLAMPGGFVAVDSYKGAGVKPYRPQTYPAVPAEDLAFIAGELDADVEALYGLRVPGDRGAQ